jgi:peptide/nickel transport system permease protein
MGQFILRRLLLMVFTLLMISLLVFSAIEIVPGDAAQMILGQRATPETLEALRTRLGLDQPAYVRYFAWISGVARGDWGESLVMNVPVGPLLAQRLRNSLVLAVIALLVATPLGILAGVFAGLNPGRWADHSITTFTLFAVSFPSFVTAIFLIIVMASWLRWLPASSLIPPDANLWESARFLVLPVLTLTLGMLAHVTRHTRSSLIEVMGSDYMRTAKSKGLPRQMAILRHALRNALLPTISVIALNVGWLLSGVVLVESVFAYPGMGRLMLQAINTRDLPVLMAVTLASAAIYALANLSADLLYRWLNPRIRYS